MPTMDREMQRCFFIPHIRDKNGKSSEKQHLMKTFPDHSVHTLH